MPRKPRIHYPGAFYHVMLRGNAGQDIFFDAANRSRFLLLLQQGLTRYRQRVHAYCLMDNHVHLLLQVDDVSLSKLMQNLGFRYTQYVNRTRKQTGHLFQGRFKALLIDADNYLLELVRYIHLNPVRAGLVEDPADFPWSSHQSYLDQITPWLVVDPVLGQLSGDRAKARQIYQNFIFEGMGQGHERKFQKGTFQGRVLGDERFVQEAELRAGEDLEEPPHLRDVLRAVCSVYEIGEEELSAPGRHQPHAEARAVAAWLVKQCPGLPLKELSTALQRDLSGLSQGARRIELRAVADVSLREKLTAVKQAFHHDSPFVKPDP
jgi:putative transposase